MNNSFVALDFETANSFKGSACEIGLARVIDGRVEARFETLLMPHFEFRHFDGINIGVHGIRASDVQDALEFDAIWPQVNDFVGELPLVAHNAAFDTRVLRELFHLYEMPVPTFRYVCTLRVSRQALDLVSYSLPFVAEALGIQQEAHHRAGSDAQCAAQIAAVLVERSGLGDLESLCESLRVSVGRFDGDTWYSSRSKGSSRGGGTLTAARIEEIRSSLGESFSEHADPDGPLYGQRVAFTGGLLSMTRAEAAAKVLAAGGEPQSGVNKSTNFLVIGTENGFTIDPRTAVTAKFDKAEALRAKGAPIEILDELTFTRML